MSTHTSNPDSPQTRDDFYETARRVKRTRTRHRIARPQPHSIRAHGRVLVMAALLALPFAPLSVPVPAWADDGLSPVEALGKAIFFDASLSEPAGQACATCHMPEAGFAGPASATDGNGGVEPGIVTGRFGNRKAPSISYAAYSPKFHLDTQEDHFVGGQFWDGRAATLADQARQPFVNPLEMNNASEKAVCGKVQTAPYAEKFASALGRALDCSGDGKAGMDLIAQALTAYQASHEVNPFSSKFDAVMQGEATFTPLEKRGKDLFDDPKRAACAECHPSTPLEDGGPVLFTDFTYDNLGMPANPANPFYRQDGTYNPDGRAWKDTGLGGKVGRDEFIGAFKVPSLRNVAMRADGQIRTYGHNGVFTRLEDIVHFYNTRDVKGALPGGQDWAAPEFPATMNTEELGDLKLSREDEAAIVAFLQTLSDGYTPNGQEQASAEASR